VSLWSKGRAWIHHAWPMLVPLLLGVVVFYFLREPLDYWRHGDQRYDEQAMKEWVREARVGDRSMPELLRDFLDEARISSKKLKDAQGDVAAETLIGEHELRRREIEDLLNALCVPPSKIYAGQLPLFPVIYRLEVRFDKKLQAQIDERLKLTPIAWDSESPRHSHQYRELDGYDLLRDEGVTIYLQYTLHAYLQKQFRERRDEARSRLINIWVLFFAFGALLWMFIMQRRESAREHQRLITEQQIQETRQKHLEEELRRQEAERKQEVAERKQLEEELRRQEAEREKQEAERQALELKSQMFHSIGIMAKSYAHNIKNLLVRPNDLLRRCLEEHPTEADATRMLHEIQQTLGTVTERLQEILQTVQRDPNQFERVQVDLNALVYDLHKTWAEQAESKWKMLLDIELGEGRQARDEGREERRAPLSSPLAPHHSPLIVSGDRSHLQQTLENFLFNARDAISEMRNHLRKQARPEGAAGKGPLDETQRNALIAAAGWKGRVLIRTCVIGNQPVIEVHDNGIGMTPETRDHCTEPHYSTKRNNALYAGMSAGMGLGLSFVQMILQHHGATLEIESEPLKGTLFRVRFPVG
jgi:signal transduction histidine kinase